MGATIRVDIDELIEKLTDMKNDEYATAELVIESSTYTNELSLSAVSFDQDEPESYGTLCEVGEEL